MCVGPRPTVDIIRGMVRFPLVRISRLSVMPVTGAEWTHIEDMRT